MNQNRIFRINTRIWSKSRPSLPKFVTKTFGLDSKRFPYDTIEDLPARGSSSQSVEGKLAWCPQKKNKKSASMLHWASWPEQKKGRKHFGAVSAKI